MQWTNNERTYGWASIILHWLGALSVILMLTIGLQADWAGEAGDRARRAEIMGWHISVGATVAAPLIARVIAHYALKQPAPVAQPRPLQIISKATHHLLLLAIVLLFISGPLAVWSGGRAIEVWGAVSIPSPFAERNQDVHEIAEAVHAVGRYMLYVLIPLHVLGALKHLVIDRDNVFRRMLSPLK
jgi:cytochrome b561